MCSLNQKLLISLIIFIQMEFKKPQLYIIFARQHPDKNTERCIYDPIIHLWWKPFAKKLTVKLVLQKIP